MTLSKKQKLIVLLFYNLINILLFYIVFRGASVIYGDGPAGFGEVLVKGILETYSFFLFLGGLILSRLIYKSNSLKSKSGIFFIFIIILITMVLISISRLMIIDACSNSKGYCRNWTIHLE